MLLQDAYLWNLDFYNIEYVLFYKIKVSSTEKASKIPLQISKNDSGLALLDLFLEVLSTYNSFRCYHSAASVTF